MPARIMEVAQKDKINGKVLTISLQVNPISIKVTDADLVPLVFRKIIPETFTVDKKAITDWFKQHGEIPDGCEVVTDKKSLRIK